MGGCGNHSYTYFKVPQTYPPAIPLQGTLIFPRLEPYKGSLIRSIKRDISKRNTPNKKLQKGYFNRGISKISLIGLLVELGEIRDKKRSSNGRLGAYIRGIF